MIYADDFAATRGVEDEKSVSERQIVEKKLNE